MADGTNVVEPTSSTTTQITTVDSHEVDFGGGDVRDRQRMSLAGLGATDDVVTGTTNADTGQRGLVTRDPGLTAILAKLQALAPPSNSDANNSAAIPSWGIGATYTGAFTDVSESGSLFAFVLSYQPFDITTGNTPHVEWSSDGINPDTFAFQPVTTAIPIQTLVSLGVTYYLGLVTINSTFFRGKYYRVVAKNGAFVSSFFYALSGVGRFPATGSLLGLDDDLSQLSVAMLSRAVQAGLTPDENFLNARISGRHTGNSTVVPLNGNTGGTDHIFRGLWFEWQDGFGGMVLDMAADQDGTILVDFSEAAAPVDGVDTDVQMSQSLPYVAATTPLLRRTFTVQSRWVRIRYVNGVNAQASFLLDTAFLTGQVMPAAPFADQPTVVGLGVNTRAVLFVETAENDQILDHVTGTLLGAKRAVDVNVAGLDEGIVFKPLPNLATEQGDVNGSAVTPYPAAPLTQRATICFTNPHETVDCYYSESATKVANGQGDILMARQSKEIDLVEGTTLYWTLNSIGGSSVVSSRDGSATTAVTAATNPNFALHSDDTRAILTGATSAFEITGVSTPGSGDALAEVRLQLEGRHDPTAPATLTISQGATVTGTAGNAVSVVSGVVTHNSAVTARYLVAINRRNAASVVSTVTGMGATWAQIEDATSFGSAGRISLWYNTTPTTVDGAVTANFSTAAQSAEIAVTAYTNVDSTVFTNHENIVSGSAVSTTYSDSVVGTALGLAYVIVSEGIRTDTPGNGFTKIVEPTSAGTSTSTMAVTSLALAASGAQSYSGTLSGTTAWAAIAVALQPAPYVAPVVRVRYQVGTDPIGATALSVTLTPFSDAIYSVSVFGDRSWTFADVNSMSLFVDVTTFNGTTAELDRVGISVTETTGADKVRLCMAQVGGAFA